MRVPGKPRRLEIDFVRGVAVLVVMFSHFRVPQTGIVALDGFHGVMVRVGGAGVDLFFVLSGFLVGGLLLKEYRETGAVRPGRFLVRRMFKIWPAYYFMLLVHLIARRHPASTYFWANFFHVQNYVGSSLMQTWSLAIEEHFYLVFAGVMGLVAAWRWSAQRILWLLGVVCVLAFTLRTLAIAHGHWNAALRRSHLRMDSLAFGVMLAVLYHLLPKAYARVAAWPWLLVGMSVFGLVYRLVAEGPYLTQGFGFVVMYVASGAFLVLMMEHSGRWMESWLYRAIATVGVYSYGLYLWHSAMLSVGDAVIRRLSPGLAWGVALVVQTAGAMALAYVTTRAVEWPFLRWRERIVWLRDAGPLVAGANEGELRDELVTVAKS